MVRVFIVCIVLVVVDSFPTWYRSTRFWGIGSVKGGWLLVVGCVVGWLSTEVCASPIRGSLRMSVLWSPYFGV